MAQPSANKTQNNTQKTNQNSQNISQPSQKEAKNGSSLDEGKKQKSKTAARNVEPLIEDDEIKDLTASQKDEEDEDIEDLTDEDDLSSDEDIGNKTEGANKGSKGNANIRSGNRH